MSDSEKPIAYALTTKARVKDRLSMSETGSDTLLDRIIAGVTDLIEGEASRRFLEQTYTNEVYQVPNPYTKFVQLKATPVSTVTSVQYRAGLKSSPNWTDFAADDWEIMGDGSDGIVRIYGLFSGFNILRFTYVGGYKIDFENAGDITKHTLPFDLSDLAERLTIKLFKRREHEGKLSEVFEGATVSWKDLLDDDDKAVIARYMQLPTFV